MKKRNIVIISSAIFALTLAAAVPYYYANAASKQHFMAGQFKRGKNISSEAQTVIKQRMNAMRTEQGAKRQAINNALDAGDYSAWLAAVGENCSMTQKITQDNFSKLVEIHNLEKQIMEKKKELGIKSGNFNMFGHQRQSLKK